MEHFDYLIIGGGMVGANIANLLASGSKSHKGAIIMSPTDHCASLSNQTFLHGGGLYVKNGIVPTVSKLLAFNSGILVKRFSADLGGHGIFFYRTKEEADYVLEFYKKFNGFRGWFLTQAEIQDSLGPEFTSSRTGFYISVPDRPFNEEEILNKCIEGAARNGFEIITADGPAKFIKDKGCENGFFTLVNGRELISKYTFAAAGTGIKKLLKPLEIDEQIHLNVSRSPLLVVPENISSGRLRLFADRIDHLSVVHQRRADGSGVYLLGNKTRDTRNINLYDEKLDKTMTFEDKNEFFKGFVEYDFLSEKLREYAFADQNYSVCFKVEQYSEKNPDRIIYEPLVVSFDDIYKGLFVSISGKATLGLYTAERTLAKAKLLNYVFHPYPAYVSNLTRSFKIWYDNK